MIEERLIELEIKVAYQEDLLQALNGIVVTQQTQIHKLEETCRLLHERISSLRMEKDDGTIDQPPPHY